MVLSFSSRSRNRARLFILHQLWQEAAARALMLSSMWQTSYEAVLIGCVCLCVFVSTHLIEMMSLTFHLHGCRIIVAVQEKKNSLATGCRCKKKVFLWKQTISHANSDRRPPLVPTVISACASLWGMGNVWRCLLWRILSRVCFSQDHWDTGGHRVEETFLEWFDAAWLTSSDCRCTVCYVHCICKLKWLLRFFKKMCTWPGPRLRNAWLVLHTTAINSRKRFKNLLKTVRLSGHSFNYTLFPVLDNNNKLTCKSLYL